MDRRFMLALLLCLGFVMLWLKVISPYFWPRPPQPIVPVESPDSRKSETRPESAPKQAGASRPVPSPELTKAVKLENPELRLTFSTAGATLQHAELLEKAYKESPYSDKPLDLLKLPFDRAAHGLPSAMEVRDLGDPASWLEAKAWKVEGSDERSVTFVLEPGVDGFTGNYRIRKKFLLPEHGRHAEVTLSLEYLGTGSIQKACRLTVSGGVTLDADYYGLHDLTGAQSFMFKNDPQDGEKLLSKTPGEMAKVEAKPGDEPRETVTLNGDRRFVTDINNYFGVYCALVQMPKMMKASFVGIVDPIAEDKSKAHVIRTRVDLEFDIVAENGKPAEQKLLVYFGPNESRFIEADLTGDNAPWAVEFARIYGQALGTFGIIGRGVLLLLRAFESLTGNWGFAIMLLTFFVRLLLFPINRRSQIAMVRHSEAMSRIKPRLDVLKEKYKNDTKRFLAEQTALLKAEKVPLVPLGGCLPILLQIPIFYGLFAALRASIELRQAPFFWVKDLSQPDHLVRFAHAYPNPISKIGCCCAPAGMSDTISGIHLLPILMTAAWFLNQLLMPKPATEDPQMAQQRKMMMFLPVMMGFMMYGYGAGLSLYWLTSSVLGIFESRIIKKSLPKRTTPQPKAAT